MSVDGLHYSVPLYPSWRLGLSRNCATRNILNNVTLHVPDGTLMAIMGNSGEAFPKNLVIESFERFSLSAKILLQLSKKYSR